MATQTKIAFLGLGAMGDGMARRLLGAGFAMAVYNRNPERAAPFAALGARVAESPFDAASGADVIISMLADDVASRAVWLGQHGALAAAAPGAVCIESSTLTVPWVKELAADAAARQLAFLDAPVTGSKVPAAEGQLIFLVGGEHAIVDAVRPVLAPMSKEIVYLGPVGSGAAFKLVNNFVSGVQVASLAEGLALAQRCGLDPQQVSSLLASGPPGSLMVKIALARHGNKDYAPNFQLRLMAKDISYAIVEAKHHGLNLQTATAALFRYTQAAHAGLGDQDLAALLKFMQQQGQA